MVTGTRGVPSADAAAPSVAATKLMTHNLTIWQAGTVTAASKPKAQRIPGRQIGLQQAKREGQSRKFTNLLQDAQAFCDFSKDHMVAIALWRRCKCYEELGCV